MLNMDAAHVDSFAEAQLYALVEVAAGAAGAHRLDDVLELAAPRDERYALSEFPTTLRVLADGGKVIYAVDDPASDPAHRKDGRPTAGDRAAIPGLCRTDSVSAAYCSQESTVSAFFSTQSWPASSGSTLSPAIALATASWSALVISKFFSMS